MSQKINYIVNRINKGIKKYTSDLQLSHQTPGFSILIKKDNETVYTESIGKSILSSRSSKNFISPSSHFLCASLTKLVVCQFFIHLNKKYPKIFQTSLDHFFGSKHKKHYIRNITIQHLLTHRSGLSEYFGSPSSIPYHQLNRLNLKQITKYILDQKNIFTAGKKMYLK